MKHTMTLEQIRAAKPCEAGWKMLLTGLGYTDGHYDAARQITIGDVAVINGADDALWCLQFVDDSRLRVRAIMPAVERAARYTTDARVHKCIVLLHEWLDGADDVDFGAWPWQPARAAYAQAEWVATMWMDAWTAGAVCGRASVLTAATRAAAHAAAALAAAEAVEAVRDRAVAVAAAAALAAAARAAYAQAEWVAARGSVRRAGEAAAKSAAAARAAERTAQVNELCALFGRSPR